MTAPCAASAITAARETTVLFSLAGQRVFVAGHRGMVGSALVRRLARENCEILTVGRGEVDLRRQNDVDNWLAKAQPSAVFVAAATVGGIFANSSRPAEFLYDNVMIAANVIEASRRAGVRKLIFLGSSCIYPRLAPQPMAEEALLSGPLEPTNEWYGIAKIAGLKMCAAYRRQFGCDFISAQPTNLYGPHDNFDLKSSHVVAALIAKIHQAKVTGAASIEIWGSGKPRREFLHVDDLADALVFLMQNYSDEQHINVGWGKDLTISEFATLIAETAGFGGSFRYDASKPDGAPQKILDVSRLSALGWRPQIPLRQGIADAYRWYVEHVAAIPAASL
jgi:GDP-L-fucose synthase